MENCIFCRIISGKSNGYVIDRNKDSITLLDIFPSVEGHVMVVPIRHGETILDFSAEELGKIMENAKRVVKALSKTYNTSTFSIGINHGEFGGVPHLHIHIIPRQKEDGGGIIQSLIKKESKEDFTIVAEKIKKNITD